MRRNTFRHLHRAAGYALALVFATPPLLAQQTPPAEPAQKQADPAIRGDTAEITSVERVVITGMVPIPNVGQGAPYHSPEELAAMMDKTEQGIVHTDAVDIRTRMCRLSDNKRLSMNYPSLETLMDAEIQAGKRFVTEAQRAKAATEAAEQTRRDATDGKVDMKVVEEAELARQTAVNKVEDARIKYLEAGAAIADFQDFERQGYKIPDVNAEAAPGGKILTWGDLDLRADRRRKAGYWQGRPVPDPAPGIHIEQVEAHQREGKRGVFIEITGLVRNDRKNAATVPDLNVIAIDGQGFILIANPIDASGSRIPPLSARPFAYQLKPAPDAITRVAVAFASSLAPPPRTYLKAPPGCDGAAPPD